MKNSEVFDSIMKRLGNRKSTDLRATVVIELNKKICDLENDPTLPWFCEQVWSTQMIANQNFVPLPVDFSREVEEGRFKVQNPVSGAWCRIIKKDLEAIEDAFDNCLPVQPKAYALFGTNCYFGPTPDKTYKFKVPYFAHSAVVVDDQADVTNGWLLNFYNYLTLATMDIIGRTHTRDLALVTGIAPALGVAMNRFVTTVEARQQVNREYLLDNVED